MNKEDLRKRKEKMAFGETERDRSFWRLLNASRREIMKTNRLGTKKGGKR